MDAIWSMPTILVILNPLDWSSVSYFLLMAAIVVLRMAMPEPRRLATRVLGEILLLAPAVLLYFGVRGLVDAREADAVRNAQQILDLEHLVGIGHELTMQQWVIGSDVAVNLMNWVYIWAHWPVLVAALVWLVVWRPHAYPLYRNVLLASGAVGMVIFALYPVAPPRLMPDLAFVDTVTLRSQSYRVLQPSALTNPFAAMPSLHFGWNLIVGIAVFREARHRIWRWLGVVLPVAMLLAIVLTANHYLLDAVVGGVLVVSCVLLVSQMMERFPDRGRLHDAVPHGRSSRGSMVRVGGDD